MGRYVKKAPSYPEALDITAIRMVGVTRIELVTPTMSTFFPLLQPLYIREKGTTQFAVSGM